MSRATNQKHNSRARAERDFRAACLPRAKPRRVPFFYALLRGLAYSLPAQPARRGGRMLPARENFRSSELAPVMTTTLSLISCIRC